MFLFCLICRQKLPPVVTSQQKERPEALLEARGESQQTWLGWLRQTIGAPNPNNILACIERLKFVRELGIPMEWARRIHENRLVQTAREGASTRVAHLGEFGMGRRYATLVAIVLDTATILIDETLEMHERILGKYFKKAERKHLQTFQDNGKAINDKVRLYALIGSKLIEAKENAADPFTEIEKLMSWETFKASVQEAAELVRPGEFDYLALVTESYPQLRRYAAEFLEVFEFRSTPASEELLKAVTLLRELNSRNARRVPDEAPTSFIRTRWEKYVFTKEGIDRRFYETCVLSELGKALRAGDLWVAGSRRYKDLSRWARASNICRKATGRWCLSCILPGPNAAGEGLCVDGVAVGGCAQANPTDGDRSASDRFARPTLLRSDTFDECRGSRCLR